MTTRRENRCQTKGCPHPNDDGWHRCFVCGKQPIDHQHFPKKSLAGKGAKIVAALCRRHHDMLSLNKWHEGVYDHKDGTRHYYIKDLQGKDMCDRVIGRWENEKAALTEVDNPVLARIWNNEDDDIFDTLPAPPGSPEPAPELRESLPAVKAEETPIALEPVSDEELGALFTEADKVQAKGFLLKCRIVSTFRERHVQAWGESWIEQAYELFHVSRRTLEVYARLHEIVASSSNYLVENIGPLTDSRSLMRHIGYKTVEDGCLALEAAVAHVAEFGEPPTVAALHHRLGEEKEDKPPDVCPKTDGEHEWERKCKKCGVVK